MFEECSSLTGSVPNLPQNLNNGYYMFSGCSNLSGNTPPMPPNLTLDSEIFKNTQITNDDSWPNSAFW